MSLSLKIGARFSRAKSRNHLVSFISLSSMIGIAVSVALILIGLSAINGFGKELQDRVISVVPHVELVSRQAPLVEWRQVIDDAKQYPNVLATSPYVTFTGLLEKGSELKAVQVRGVDSQSESQVSNLSQYIDQDAWQNLTPDQGQIILGSGIAELLNVKKGDSLTIMIPPAQHNTQASDGFSNKISSPQRIRLTVAGLLTLHGSLDHNLAIVPLKDAQTYLEQGDAVTGISIKIDDIFQADQVAISLAQSSPYYLSPRTWKQQSAFLYDEILLIKTIMYLVMFLVISVACFNIVSTLMMAVKDRSSDIAILSTMGAQKGLIIKIFIWYGVFSGILGCLIGSVVGVLISYNLSPIFKSIENLIGHQFLSGNIYFIDFLPSLVKWQDVVVVALTAIVLSLVATLYPAFKASKLNPARVLSAK